MTGVRYSMPIIPSRQVGYGTAIAFRNTIMMHPVDLWLMTLTHDEALQRVADDMTATVDRRLRGIGLFPKTPGHCGHPDGLGHDLMRMVYQCPHCGTAVTDESLARRGTL